MKRYMIFAHTNKIVEVDEHNKPIQQPKNQPKPFDNRNRKGKRGGNGKNHHSK